MTQARLIWLNLLGLLAICAVLLFAFADQIIYGDIPCPLCILQRAGFIAAGTGLALNLGFGIRPSHYATMILGALVVAGVATRQILLHIVPGTGAYGNPFLGLHFYTWSFIVSVLIISGGAILLAYDRQFVVSDPLRSPAASRCWQWAPSGADLSRKWRFDGPALRRRTLPRRSDTLHALAIVWEHPRQHGLPGKSVLEARHTQFLNQCS